MKDNDQRFVEAMHRVGELLQKVYADVVDHVYEDGAEQDFRALCLRC